MKMLPNDKSLCLVKLHADGLYYRTLRDEISDPSPVISKICNYDQIKSRSIEYKRAAIEKAMEEARKYDIRPIKSLADIILRPSKSEVMQWFKIDFTLYWLEIKKILTYLKTESSPQYRRKINSAWILEKLVEILSVVKDMRDCTGDRNYLRISFDCNIEDGMHMMKKMIKSGATYNQVLSLAIKLIQNEVNQLN